ncbi:MAG TPA: CoA pyrophosphatase [Dongiaceae bacterium]|nr:CoA pyrophosphatase [Dongiaceae bacterium]
MEQRSVLPAGKLGSHPLSAEELAARLAAAPPPGLRRSQDARPRGDHDLNPDMYPTAPLVSAAVLVPIIARREGLTALFTLRTAHLSAHAGQISFPGGRVEPADADETATALREVEEEIGLPREKVRLIGRLDTYVTRTGFRIHPLVGLISAPLALRPDPREVAEVFEVPLDFLTDPANCRRHSRIYQGQERFFWAIPFGQRYIWGATAGIVVNLSELLRPTA